MSKHDKGTRGGAGKDGGSGDLAEAALALERELLRFEELGAAARRMPLDTRKNIERAAKATTEAATGQERVNATLGALVAAITAARVRHEANALALTTRGEEIGVRAGQLGTLYERYSALGEEAQAVNRLVQEAAAKQRDATTPERTRELAAALQDVDARMSTIVDGARELGQAARTASITDVAEQADALRQQVAAARNKIGLLTKELQGRAADASKLN